MKLAFECPISLLDKVQPYGDFDWILPHLLTNPKYYEHYYRSTRIKVMDNSVNEKGKPIPVEEVLYWANDLKVDYIVPPDFLNDYKETLKSLYGILGKVDQKRLLPVVQGSNPKECIACSMYIRNKGFDRVAVPYDICCRRTESLDTMAERRSEVVHRIAEGFSWIHLLGMTSPTEFETYREGLRGTRFTLDTGSPSLHGVYGIDILKGPLFDKTVCSLARMDGNTPDDLTMVFRNIVSLRRLTDGIGRA